MKHLDDARKERPTWTKAELKVLVSPVLVLKDSWLEAVVFASNLE
jgi:hypothetical protein